MNSAFGTDIGSATTLFQINPGKALGETSHTVAAHLAVPLNAKAAAYTAICILPSP